MENASKALLMAGGMLLVMLIVAVVIYAWGVFSDYYSSQEDLADIQNLTEFNLQFTNYERDDVTGSELLSLINKVIDYNERYSSDGTNNEGYAPITLELNMGDDLSKIAYDDVKLFTNKTYTLSGTSSSLSDIISTINGYENDYGKENLQNLAKAIDSIFTENYTAEYRVTKFNSITSSKYASNSYMVGLYSNIENYAEEDNYSDAEKLIQNNFKTPTLYYYEYVQFKKAIFTAYDTRGNTTIEYDSDTGRVSSISFTYSGKVQ